MAVYREDSQQICSKNVKLHSLLSEVKITVEGLLSTPTSNVWNIYGGLKRLSSCVEKILNHRLKYSQNSDGSSKLDYHHFIKTLHWLNPVLVPSADRIKQRAIDERITEGQAWVRQSLQSHTMSAQFKALVGDRQNLLQSYYDDAFLCQPDYFQALCICLKAVEQNEPALLTNIDHSLLLSSRRSLSFTPSASPRRKSNSTVSSPMISSGERDLSVLSSTDPLTDKYISNSVTLRRQNSDIVKPVAIGLSESARVTSVDCLKLDSILNHEGTEEELSDTLNNKQNGNLSPRISKGKQPMKNLGHSRSKSDMTFLKGQTLEISDKPVEERTGRNSTLSTSLPDSSMEERIRNASFRENGETMAYESYFPQPRQGESLKSFLSSQDFDTCADLDRENAHFAISEALIAAIERMKWNQVLRPIEDTVVGLDDVSEEESDEEIMKLKEKIQERRRMKRKSLRKKASSVVSLQSTPKSSSHSGSHKDSDSVYSSDSTADDFYAHSLSDSDSLLTLRDGITLSDRLSMDSSNLVISAEQVALSLLSNFDELHLPKASELEWLVSEKDAPQALLPLPISMPISPDDMLEGRKGTRIRGNAEWAPPRAQIIFNVHSAPNRKVLISKQNLRCAGCGMKTEPGYIKRFRYCEYLGKYFCQCCHSNALSIIPARIIHKWDFKRYYVSNFAHELLNRMSQDPLFNISDINPRLIKKVKVMERVWLLRLQLRSARPFLASCRQGNEFYGNLLKLPPYLLDDINTYSIKDLLEVKSGILEKILQTLVSESVSHITTCELCQAKGFICEICDNEKDIIFPFQIHKVARCQSCQACYHQQCFEKHNKACPKCTRREHREHLLKAQGTSNEN